MFLSLSLFVFVVIYSLKNIKVEEINKCFFIVIFYYDLFMEKN
jgi:hypothetical protein